MKKLKIGLILAFSMLLTLGLAACGGNEDDTVHNISSIRFGDASSVELSEGEASAVRAQFDTEVDKLELRVYADNAREIMSGADFTWDTSAVTWDAPGSYTAVGTPVLAEDSAIQNANNVTVSLEVNVNHNFGAPNADGVSRCEGCGATRTAKTYETPVQVNYEAFHAGPTSATTADPDGFLQRFGTVPTEDGNMTVNSYTAGTLTRGMTISVSGVGTNNNNTSATWYFPILGIAVRDLTNSAVWTDGNWSANVATTGTTAEGGAGVLVRNDGWVLLDGIGDSPNRFLNAFGGTNATSIVATMPAAEDMAAWWPYATGTPCYSAEYTGNTDVTYTWSFSDDGIVEMIIDNETAGAVLTIRVRVPDGVNSVDTVLHGEYFNLAIDTLTITEMDLLANVTAELVDGAKSAYVEGEYFNFADLNVQTSFASAPDSYSTASSFVLQAYTGEETEAAAMQADGENWTTVADDTPLLSAYQNFRVRVLVGSTVKYAYFNVGEEGFIDEIAPNSVDSIFGHDYDATYVNDLALGQVGYSAVVREGVTYVSIAPSAVANRNGTEQYLTFRLWAAAGETFSSNVSTLNAVPVKVAADGTYADVLVKLSAELIESGAVISGLQETPIYLDLSGVTMQNVSATVTGADEVSFSAGGDVTFTYTFTVPEGTTAESDEIQRNVSIGIGNVPTALRRFDWEGNNFSNERGLLVGNTRVPVTGSVAITGTTATLTVTYEIPGFTDLSGSHPGYFAVLFDYDGVTTTDRVFYGQPTATEGVAVIGGSLMVKASGTNIIFSVMAPMSDVEDMTGCYSGVDININTGAATPEGMFGLLGLEFDIVDGAAVATDTLNPLISAYTPTIQVIGTANEDRDTDIGFIYTGVIDASAFGATDESEYYIEVRGLGETFYLHVVGESVSVVEAPAMAAQDTTLAEGSCIIGGVSGKAVTKDGKVIFYADVQENLPSHTWVEQKNEANEGTGIFECSVCHVLYMYEATGMQTGPIENATKNGLTLTATTSGATSDWAAQILATASGNVLITLPNLDPWNIVQDDMTAEQKALAELVAGANCFPSAAGVDAFENGSTYDIFLNVQAFTTITLSPTDGIKYYKDGLLVFHYRASAPVGDGTVADFVNLFLSIAESEGVVVGKGGVTVTDAIVSADVFTEAEILAMVSNNDREDYYDHSHVHNYHADVANTAENYDRCACGKLNPAHTPAGTRHVAAAENAATETLEANYCRVCGGLIPGHLGEGVTYGHTAVAYAEDNASTTRNETYFCQYCDQVMPGHTHVYETNTAAANYGFCGCGTKDPAHGTTADLPHVYENAFCKVCGAYDSAHTHSYNASGVCACGSERFSVTVGDVTYNAEPVWGSVVNNDVSGDWWNGATTDMNLNGNAVAIFTWENTRDTSYADYAVEVAFNSGAPGDGQFITIDYAGGWTAEWVSATAPTITHRVTGTQPALGTENACAGTFEAVVTRIGTTVTITVSFTPDGESDVSWTKVTTVTGCPATGSAITHITGNPFFLDNITGYAGALTAAE